MQRLYKQIWGEKMIGIATVEDIENLDARIRVVEGQLTQLIKELQAERTQPKEKAKEGK